MTTVRQLLQLKGKDVWTVVPEATLVQALQIMAEKNVGALVVTQEGRPVGIFSERDYARNVVLKGRSAEHTQVSEVMTPRVYYVHLDQTLDECMALMTEKHIRHLPVIEADQLVGIISIGDVVKQIISEHEFTIQNLENYIIGGR
jgi:CBS domain-containing protein